MLRLIFLLALLLVSAVAKPRGWGGMMGRSNSSSIGTRTMSAIQARQLTRERLIGRTEKLTMANLFGRQACTDPQPSTLACTCGDPWHLCDAACRNFDTDPSYCGSCSGDCGGDTPGCCGGECTDLGQSTVNCGTCGNLCDGSDLCCSGSCTDTSSHNLHCGACDTVCDPTLGGTCCGGACVTLSTDHEHCGECGLACSETDTCCGSACTDIDADANNCGSCGNVCDENPGGYCADGGCQYP